MQLINFTWFPALIHVTFIIQWYFLWVKIIIKWIDLSLFLSGLKQIHVLSIQGNYELRIDLEDFENSTAFAQYGVFGVGLFSVDPEDDGYPLTIADYTGTAGTHTYLHIKYKYIKLGQYLQYCAIRMPCLNHMLNIQLTGPGMQIS